MDKNNIEKEKAVTLSEAANITYLSPETAFFEKNGDFIKARIISENGEENSDNCR